MAKPMFQKRVKLDRTHSTNPGTRKTRRWEARLTGLESAINKANRAARVSLYRARKALHESEAWESMSQEECERKEWEILDTNSSAKQTKIAELRREWNGIEMAQEEEEGEDEEDEEESIISGNSEEEEDDDDPEFDGYDDEPAADEEEVEVDGEIVGSFQDVIKRLNERIRICVIVPWERMGSFDENADSSSYDEEEAEEEEMEGHEEN